MFVFACVGFVCLRGLRVMYGAVLYGLSFAVFHLFACALCEWVCVMSL